MTFHFRIISCKDLPIKDANGSIDSYVVLETKGKDNKPRKMGRTKTVQNNLNPVYPEQVIDVPSDDCYTVKFTVFDEDVLKDDTACWIKIKVASLMTKLGDKLTKEMLVKNPENHPNCHASITFIVTLDGDLDSSHPGKKVKPSASATAIAPLPKPKEIMVVEPIPDHNKYDFDILVLDPENKKFYFSESARIPYWITKDGDKYTIDPEDRNLIIVPIFRTLREFSKTVLQVRCNDLVLRQDLIYRGEWLMNQALLLPSKLIKQFKPLHRNNHGTNKWIALLPDELAPKGNYTEW